MEKEAIDIPAMTSFFATIKHACANYSEMAVQLPKVLTRNYYFLQQIQTYVCDLWGS